VGEIIRLHDRPLNPNRAIQRMRRCLKEGAITWAVDARTKLRARRLDILDVVNVIRYGRVVDRKRPMDLWRYTVEGPCADGRNTWLIVEIGESMIIITAYPRRPRR